jgi:hypothetical protein
MTLGMNLTAFSITIYSFNWYRTKREDKLKFKLSVRDQPSSKNQNYTTPEVLTNNK